MITITDVVKAINNRLKQAFPKVTIQASDVSEGYTRPCFYTEVTDLTTDHLMTAYDRKIAVISILFFPTDQYNYQVEMLEVRERLQGAFIGTLTIKDDFIVHILDVTDTVSDGVLNLDMEIEYYILRSDRDYPSTINKPLMENLEIENN